MFPSLTSVIIAVKPRIDATAHWIYQKTFSAKDRIAFYDMLAFLLDNNKSLQQAFMRIRMRSIIDSHLRSITFSHRNRSPGNLTFLSF